MLRVLVIYHNDFHMAVEIEHVREKMDLLTEEFTETVGFEYLRGRVLTALPPGVSVGGQIKVHKGDALKATLRILDAKGHFKSNGAFVYNEQEAVSAH